MLQLDLWQSRFSRNTRWSTPGWGRASFDQFFAIDAPRYESTNEQSLGRTVIDSTSEPSTTGEFERVTGHFVSHDDVLNHPFWRNSCVVVAYSESRQNSQIFVLRHEFQFLLIPSSLFNFSRIFILRYFSNCTKRSILNNWEIEFRINGEME